MPYPRVNDSPTGDGKPSPYVAYRYRRIRVPDGHCIEKRSGVSCRLTGKSNRKSRPKELRQSLRLQRTFLHSKRAKLCGELHVLVLLQHLIHNIMKGVATAVSLGGGFTN